MAKKFLAPGEKITNYSTWKLVKDIYRYVRPYKGSFFIGSILKLISEVLWLYPTYAFSTLVTIISAGSLAENSTKIWTITSLWIGATILAELIQYFARVEIFNIADKIAIDAEQKALTHMFKLDIAWHEKENTGNKIKRISNASSGLTKLLRIWVNGIIGIVVNLVGVVVIIYHFNKAVALMTFAFLVVYYIITKLLLKKAALSSHYVNVATEEVSGLQFEAVNNIRSVKIMSMINTLVDRLQFYSDKLYEKTQLRVFWFMNRNSGSQLFGFIFKGGILLYIINGILHGQLELGLLILFSTYFNRVWDSITQLTNVSEDILVSRYALSRLDQIFKEPILIDDESEKKVMPSQWKKITLKNVSFSYGENQVLKNISFEINRGEKVGIIGLSGAGKSTLYKLLLKEYENFDGEILVDNTRIQEISKHDYFKHVAVVLQETEVFNFSLRENIYLAGPGTANKEVELQKALEIAHVTEFLPKLPDGVDTPIGEKGVRLSGGEKQRLGIARAVFKQPQFLLLDEATSHLDLESEEKIQDSLHKFFRTVTAVVIAHRLTTIKEMDKILVVEDGQIIESGNFAELTAKRGRFYELWEKQRL
ncbi:MAG TPA: ABC transporter ATP-binding protein [Patescibacteria group bacterium]|jgi:ABC-type multidrug transport system fused ATPase/permease subunit|nr:ABC transporter ATP-binding protein [Patescibacteria group bacterium]